MIGGGGWGWGDTQLPIYWSVAIRGGRGGGGRGGGEGGGRGEG